MSIFFKYFKNYYEESSIKLVDVGALGGIPKHWERAKDYLQVIGFEPNKNEFELLNHESDNSMMYLNTGLYNEKCDLKFYITKAPGSSSIFPINKSVKSMFPESDRWDIVETTSLSVDTLDNQLRENNIRDVDFLKVDTQGSELFILEGATYSLENYIFGVEVEVYLFELYKNQPLFSDVDKFLRKHDFELFDISSVYYKRNVGMHIGKTRGQIMWADAIYLKNSECFVKNLSDKYGKTDKTHIKTKILKAVSSCLIYGYIDYALEIVNLASINFSDKELIILKKEITSHTSLSVKIPNFKGRAGLSRLAGKLFRFLEPSHYGWYSREDMLGNLRDN